MLHSSAQVLVGLVASFIIGVVASVTGVAGGELLVPTRILLFGADVRLASRMGAGDRMTRSSPVPASLARIES